MACFGATPASRTCAVIVINWHAAQLHNTWHATTHTSPRTPTRRNTQAPREGGESPLPVEHAQARLGDGSQRLRAATQPDAALPSPSPLIQTLI